MIYLVCMILLAMIVAPLAILVYIYCTVKW